MERDIYDISMEEAISRATDYASEQFVEVLNDYRKETEFFENYDFKIVVEKCL